MNKKIVGLILFLLIILAGASFGSFMYFQSEEWEDKIYTGVTVMDKVDLSGLDKSQAKDKLIDLLENEMLKKEITVNLDGENHKITYEELEARYDIDKTIDNAIKFGKDKSFIEKYKMMNKDNNVNFDVAFDYSREKLDEFVEEIKLSYDKEPRDATITMVKSGVFNVTPEQVGQTLNDMKLKEYLIANISSDVEENVTIEAPVNIIEPKVRESVLKSINTKIASAKTSYKTSGSTRSHNVALATSSIGGVLLMPGERFSFNDTVGKRTVARGYQVSKVIIGNELVDGVGGGVCQVSTTLYHAVMKTGLMFFERMNHSLPSSYSELGQDATVADGAIDYKFTNTFDYPVFIESYTKNKEVYVNIYADESVKKGDFVMVSEIEKVIEAEVKKVEDPEMYVGEEEVVKSPKKGYIVKVYREHIVNGKVVERKFISRDTYKSVAGETKVGTKEKPEVVSPM